MNNKIAPHLLDEHSTVSELVREWDEARTRTFLAKHQRFEARAADYWTELECGTAIAAQVVRGRWCAIAELLRLGALESWAKANEAIGGQTAVATKVDFIYWLKGQVDLGRGMDMAEATKLAALAEAVPFDM